MEQVISSKLLGCTAQQYPVYELLLIDESKSLWQCYITELPSGVDLLSQVQPVLLEQKHEEEAMLR